MRRSFSAVNTLVIGIDKTGACKLMNCSGLSSFKLTFFATRYALRLRSISVSYDCLLCLVMKLHIHFSITV